MSLKTDRNGMFIFGMTNTDELSGFLKHKFTEHQIQQAYDYLVEASKNEAREKKKSPLRVFWQHLKKVYNEINESFALNFPQQDLQLKTTFTIKIDGMTPPPIKSNNCFFFS